MNWIPQKKTIDKLKSDGGFTLVELTIATTVFAIGMVGLMGSLVEVTKFSNFTDGRSISNASQHYVLEQMDDLEGDNILTFDLGTIFVENDDGTFALGTMGDVDVAVFAVLDEVNGIERLFEVGSDNPDGVVVPNPVEVRVVISAADPAKEEGAQEYGHTRDFNYTMSKLIAY
jgi:prepilin-type N-terminal cleavage/methylation domain-containing protein